MQNNGLRRTEKFYFIVGNDVLGFGVITFVPLIVKMEKYV